MSPGTVSAMEKNKRKRKRKKEKGTARRQAEHSGSLEDFDLRSRRPNQPPSLPRKQYFSKALGQA